ncbi:MAG: hypothetical protein O6952_03890 [Planctomycetota bacterium]|nr:hypothetical protein [Planctomycetota bacterium]
MIQRGFSVLFLGALWREISGVLDALENVRTLPIRSGRASEGTIHGESVAVVACGIGRDRAVAAAREVLDGRGARALVNIGFAGGLTEDCSPPCLVLADSILHNGHELTLPAEWVAETDQTLRDSAAPYLKGRVITVDHPLRRASDKREAGKRWNAVAAEMEAFHLARLAQERRVPFLCVRAVSDGVNQDLPDTDSLLGPAGEPSFRGVAAYLLRHPGETTSLIRLAGSTRAGRRMLASFARIYLRRGTRMTAC